jgi:formate hydrogenlyase subunit 3/multisubunit Na+/H+ antiporter MnhD subunit
MRILRTKLNLKHALVSSVVSIVVIAFYVDYKEVYWFFFFFLLTGVLCVALAVLELNL